MWIAGLLGCTPQPQETTDPIVGVDLPGCGGQYDDPIDEYAYVVDAAARSLRQVNPRSCTVGRTTPLGAQPTTAAVTGSGSWIYVGDARDESLTVVRESTNEVETTVALPFAPDELLFEPAHTVLWAAERETGRAVLVESEHHTIVGEAALAPGFSMLATTDAPPQTMLAAHGDGFVQVIDAALREEIGRVELSGPPLAVGYASNTERAFVCVGGEQPELAVIPASGPTAWIVTDHIPLEVPCTSIRFNGYAVGVAVQTDADTALVIDPARNEIAAEIPVGSEPDLVVLNGAMAAVGNRGSGDVSVISLDERIETARADTGGSGRGRWLQDGLDPNFVYAHVADEESLVVIDLRDGSTRLRVYVGEVGEMVVAGPRGGKCH